MFDKSIIDTDRFTDMPMSTKALYFLLGMEADDFGFVSPKRIMRMHGGTDDDVKILVAKSFVIPFESGVLVITDWNKHNWLDKRHIKPTEHKEELKTLRLVDKKYHLGTAINVSDTPREILEDSKNTLRESQEDSKDSLGQISKDKISLDKSSINTSAELSANADPPRSSVETKPEQGTGNVAITLTLNDKTEHPVYEEQVQQWAALYPAVNVIQQLRNMKGWLDSNPSKRKTKRGILKFINAWLARMQDKGGTIDFNDKRGGVGHHGHPGSHTEPRGQRPDQYANITSAKL